MLLVIDVGNTNIVLGIYDQDRLVQTWRVHTDSNITADEFNVLAMGLFSAADLSPAGIEETIISCVVPPMVDILNGFCTRYLGHSPQWVDPRTTKVIPILYSNPAEVGADRIVNAVAAYEKYKTALIIIDFGTATTFDAVTAMGEYLGGAISPGIKIAAEALFRRASKLPRVELFKPPSAVIGRDTIASIQSGIIFGYAGLVDGMVERMRTEMATSPRVVATGGLAPLIGKVSRTIESVEPDLTIEGLRLIYRKSLRCKDA